MVKSKKRAWRKAEVDDVEDAAEDERILRKLKRTADVSAGPGRASGLFTLDTAGSSEGLSRRSKREIARAALFPQKERKLGYSGAQAAMIDRQVDRLHDPPAKVKQAVGAFDLWGSTKGMPAQVREEHAANDFHSRRMPIPLPKKKPETMHQKVGVAPAVIPAEEGQSLNPEQKAFEAVLTAAVDQQLEKERKERELDAAMLPVTHTLRELLGEEKVASMDDAEKTEAYQNLVLASDRNSVEAEGTAELPTKRLVSALKQKSQSFRNKNKRLKVVERKEARQRLQRKLVKQVGQIDSIVKELDKEEFLQKQRKQAREAKKARAQELERSRGILSTRRRIGRATFEEVPIPVPQAAEASRGMRRMPVQPLAIQERFASYSRRGMLPAAPEATPSQVRKARDSMKRVKRMRKDVPSPLVRDSMFVRRV